MNDKLATLKAAEAAGATIQAYTLFAGLPAAMQGQGEKSIADCGPGYWRDIEGPVQWTCHPSRYRVKVEGA